MLGAGRQQHFDGHPALGVQPDANDIGAMAKDEAQELAGGYQSIFHN